MYFSVCLIVHWNSFLEYETRGEAAPVGKRQRWWWTAGPGGHSRAPVRIVQAAALLRRLAAASGHCGRGWYPWKPPGGLGRRLGSACKKEKTPTLAWLECSPIRLNQSPITAIAHRSIGLDCSPIRLDRSPISVIAHWATEKQWEAARHLLLVQSKGVLKQQTS